jgi:hypothetical protein
MPVNFFNNIQKLAPFPIMIDVDHGLNGYGSFEKLADTSHHMPVARDPLTTQI